MVALLSWRPSIDTGQRVQLHTTAEEVPEGFAVTVRTCLDGFGQPTFGYPEYPDGFAWDACSPKPAPTRAWFRRRLAADAPLERCTDVVERCKRKSSDGAGGASPAQRQRTSSAPHATEEGAVTPASLPTAVAATPASAEDITAWMAILGVTLEPLSPTVCNGIFAALTPMQSNTRINAARVEKPERLKVVVPANFTAADTLKAWNQNLMRENRGLHCATGDPGAAWRMDTHSVAVLLT